jgi:SNF2 family DNA or RNA helicase
MSVVGNWQREIERFAPSLHTMVHHGLHRRRDHTFAEEAADNDTVVTTYALAHRDRAQLRTVAWERIVLDEAQNLKNPVTLQARAVRSLRANTRVALTGTPLENRLSELWSILDTLNPGYLGTRAEFRRRYSIPIERNRDPNRREGLRRLVQPFLLRRLKTDPDVIRDLPEKLEMVVYCNLTREQAALYQAVLDEMLGAVERSSGIARRGLILAVLTRLKQVCNHPSHYLRDGGPIEGRSGKTARLAEMMEEVLAVGERALIFTQFTEMGHILRAFLAERLRTEVMFLHGGTPKMERDRMVERFSAPDGPRVFLLSLRAGGTGLNLTPATHVFHFDRWWNPAVEDQATDRAFRIGQTRRVQVHKYVCVGTLEERIDKMIRDKRELANLVVGAGEDWLTELDTGQLRDVLRLSRDAVSED